MAVPPGTVILDNPPVRVRQCRHGAMLYHLNDAYVGRSLDVYGEYSELEARLFCHILRPGMTAVDVGANIGSFTVPMARAVFPGGEVIAIEPQRLLHQMLCANVALNGLRNVRALHAGAGRAQGRAVAPAIDLAVPRNFGAVALADSGAGEAVDIVALDALGLAQCHFVKIDVEGMEAAVIEGAAETLCRERLCRQVAGADRAAARARSQALPPRSAAVQPRQFFRPPPRHLQPRRVLQHAVRAARERQPAGRRARDPQPGRPLELVGTK